MKLIVGLGNPGKTYENTRHNAGFKFIDKFAESQNLNFNKEKFDGIYTEFNYKNEKIILLKPQKYMNLSGEVLIKFKDFYKIDLNDIVLETDSPYLTPVPYRGKKNSPLFLNVIAEFISNLKGVSIDDVYRITFSNAISLFDLKDKI